MNTLSNLTTEQLRTAVEIREQIEALQGKLQAILGGEKVAETKPAKGGHNFSPEGLERIRAGQRKRWRKFRAEQKVKADAEAAKNDPPAAPVTPAVETKVEKAEAVAA